LRFNVLAAKRQIHQQLMYTRFVRVGGGAPILTVTPK
jgi:hypothetical protein